jgi:hypothetical protein
MKWIFPAIAALALAIFSLSIPAPIFSSEASAGIMNGRGNCSGGVCTGGGTTWNPSGGKTKKPAGSSSKSAK